MSAADPGSSASRRWPGQGGGVTVLDVAALVVGATVASIHLRDLAAGRPLTGLGWGLVWITFMGIALSAAGPFVLLARRFLRRQEGYPQFGDWLWTLLGLPWLLTAALRPPRLTVPPGAATGGPPAAAPGPYAATLWLTLIAVSSLALVLVWRTWVLAPPERRRTGESASWTDRVGLALAIAWPLQCGFGLVVLG